MGQESVTQTVRPTTVAHKGRATELQAKQARLAWLMLTPTILAIVFVALYPLGRTFYDSLTDASFGAATTHFIGLQNYQSLIDDTQWWTSVRVTLKFTVITVVSEFVLGMIIALVVNSSFRGRGALRAAMLVPWAIITVVNAQMWKLMFNDTYGVFNDILERLGVIQTGISWTTLTSTSLASVSVIDIWKTTPFVALLLLAGMQLIPGDVYEAARVDGANRWQQFWRITLPLLRPAILVALIFRTMDALRVFDVFFVLFGSRPDTMTMGIYDQENIVSFGRIGYGAAISVGIFVVLAIVIAIYVSVLRVQRS